MHSATRFPLPSGMAALVATLTLATVPAARGEDASAAAAPASPLATLTSQYKAAVNRQAWSDAYALGMTLVATAEKDPGNPPLNLVNALLDLATAEAETGRQNTSREHVDRAAALLKGMAEPPPALAYKLSLTEARLNIRSQRAREGVDLLRQAEWQARSNPSIDGTQRSQAFQLMIEGARSLRDLAIGNGAATDLLNLEAQSYASSPDRRAAGMYTIATWYHWSSQFRKERDQLNEAIALLEKSYGKRDVALAYPLRLLGQSYIADQDDADEASAALNRALALDLGTGPAAATEKSKILAALGDHAVVFGEPGASREHYVAAWEALARQAQLGPRVANGAFDRPIPLHVDIPSEPFRHRKGGSNFDEGTLDFGFTVTADGRIEDLVIANRKISPDNLPTPVIQAFKRARYRPRVQDGAPVATPDEHYRINFALDR